MNNVDYSPCLLLSSQSQNTESLILGYRHRRLQHTRLRCNEELVQETILDVKVQYHQSSGCKNATGNCTTPKHKNHHRPSKILHRKTANVHHVESRHRGTHRLHPKLYYPEDTPVRSKTTPTKHVRARSNAEHLNIYNKETCPETSACLSNLPHLRSH